LANKSPYLKNVARTKALNGFLMTQTDDLERRILWCSVHCTIS